MKGETIYIVVDRDSYKIEDQILGVYKLLADALSCQEAYNASSAIKDERRFVIVEETIL